jgi:hypothetical protein
MSDQDKGSVFDRYSKRKPQKEQGRETHPAAMPAQDEPSGERSPSGAQPDGLRGGHPVPEIYRNDNEDEVVQGGMYKAAFLYKAKTRPRLRLHFADGVKVKVLSYTYLIEILLTSHQWLTLVFSSSIVTLKGRNLDALVEPFQDERVRALIGYRPGIHPEPASHEPCILEIQEHSIHQVMGEKKE